MNPKKELKKHNMDKRKKKTYLRKDKNQWEKYLVPQK